MQQAASQHPGIHLNARSPPQQTGLQINHTSFNHLLHQARPDFHIFHLLQLIHNWLLLLVQCCSIYYMMCTKEAFEVCSLNISLPR